jgi:hypothetical protein
MDVLILAAGLGSRLNNYTHNVIPKYLINLDNNTGLYYIIKYWNTYATNIYLVINSNYNEITNFYISNILQEYENKIKIINYDKSDGTAYTLNYILNNDLNNVKIDNLLITWCDLYLNEPINFSKLNKSKESNIYIFTHGNQCRYLLSSNNEIIEKKECDGNIIGIYYFHNYKKFVLGDYSYNNDIVNYLNILGDLINYEINNIIDFGDEVKLLKILESKKINNNLSCRYFNDLSIIDDNKLLKKGITDKGKELIKNECNWYSYIQKKNDIFINNIVSNIVDNIVDNFVDNIDNFIDNIDNIKYNYNNSNDIDNILPKIYNIYESGYIMEYKKNYIPVYKLLMSKLNDNNIILKNIINKISKIHNIEKKKESKLLFLKNLKIEIYDKIYNRKKVITKFINYFGEINIVNNLKIDTFDNIIEKCRKILLQYYETLDKYEYSVILGDCQFSNILIDPKNINDIVFIDPRGYFGESKIYGPIEYDYAKILYGISGYDNFNTNYFNIKNIDKENKKIDFEINGITFDKKILKKYFNKVHKAYLVIIWLSLAEYNKNNIWKCLASYYYGLYLGTLL